MQFIDTTVLDSTRLTGDGYLVAEARCVRTGIQVYTGAEVGKPELATVRVYRPEAEVFSSDSLASFSHIPITDDHPREAVTAANWRDLAKGETSGEVLRDGHRLRIPLIVKDAATIRKVQDGKRELSAGYTCDLAFETGTTPAGEAYDAVQRNIRANHLAIVSRGRAGSECRIGDEAGGSWGVAPINDEAPKEGRMADTRKVMVDGLQVETTDAGAAAIEKLTKDRDVAQTALLTAEADHVKAIAAKDAEIAKAHAERDDAKGKILSDADLDKRVQARADLITVAATIAKDVKTAGLSDAAIRKAVVIAKLGDAAVAGKADAYIDARFDILAEAAGQQQDGLRNAIIGDGRAPAPTLTTDAAYEQMKERDRNAWNPNAKKEA
ncbi:DUF2213 domain-containing protein [Aureimonas flava]|uniref:DUF2213 domain-containing protein n=1 Tax=Aureimonas flava TaxID=2320271 RepID=A0A3A1WIZ2_9HYPH|nr:DUF2213 domain-containing protein [Aureimonas flava]RIY00206.1 DUF2213 domain-containing protein [Aureimonas flava]